MIRGSSASSAIECAREHDVVRVVLAGRWPDGCDAELRVHAAQCEICAEVVAVASILREDHVSGAREARVPAAGQVWWRAAVRARLEASRAAARPIAWLQGVTGACAAGFACAFIGIAWPTIKGTAGRLETFTSGLDPNTAELAALLGAAVQRSLPIVLGVAVCVLIAPIALYLVLSDD